VVASLWPVLVFVTAGLATAGVAVLTSSRADRRALVGRASGSLDADHHVRLRRRVNSVVASCGWGERLAVKLTAAGIALGPGDFMAVLGGAAFATGAVVSAMLSSRLAVIAATGAIWGVFLWVRRKRDQRRDRFVAQLPELARVLSNAASAGLAIRSAVEMAAGELDDPAGSELKRVSEELRIGQSVDGALANLERRMPSREVGVLVGTLVIQHRAGGSLISSLRDMSHTLDDRQDLRREVRTVMAGSVFTSYVVVIMGLGSLLLVNSVSPGVLDKMTSRPLGQAALALAATLYAVGFLLIRRTTRIET